MSLVGATTSSSLVHRLFLNLIEALPLPLKDAVKEVDLSDAALQRASSRGFSTTTEFLEPGSLDQDLVLMTKRKAARKQSRTRRIAQNPRQVQRLQQSTFRRCQHSQPMVDKRSKSLSKRFGEMSVLQVRNSKG